MFHLDKKQTRLCRCLPSHRRPFSAHHPEPSNHATAIRSTAAFCAGIGRPFTGQATRSPALPGIAGPYISQNSTLKGAIRQRSLWMSFGRLHVLVGYARVSIQEQDLALQLDALQTTGCSEVM